jgi:hypothetical protein
MNQAKHYRYILSGFAKLLLIFLLVLALFYFGQNIPFEKQWPLYDSLRSTASIVFGVMGAWIAIIYPEALTELLGRTLKSETTDKSREVRKLISPLIYSTAILVAVLLIGILAPIFKLIPLLVDHTRLIRGISYSFLGVLTVLQIWSVLLTLLPADLVKININRVQNKQENRQRFLSRTQDHSND